MKQLHRLYLIQLSIILCCLLLLLISFFTLGFAEEQQAQATLVITPEADTYVFSGTSTSVPPKNWRVLWVGHNESPAIQTERTLLKFNLADLPITATIQSAVFSLYLHRVEPINDPDIGISVYRLHEDWPETITWPDYVKLTQIDAPSKSIPVGSTPGWQPWEVKALVDQWRQDPNRNTYLSLVVRSNAEVGNHERAFWSKDCPVNDCNNHQPKLEIQYTLPSPPTPTSIATPGIGYLRLRNEPATAITAGDTVTYFIEYGAIDYPNRDYELTNVVITNVVPAAVELIPSSLPTPSTKLIVEHTGVKSGSLITWTLLEPVQDGRPRQRILSSATTNRYANTSAYGTADTGVAANYQARSCYCYA